jgi:hypothetical protein
MLFLSSPGGVGIAPTVELSVVIGATSAPLLPVPRFSRFRTNESHILDRFGTWHPFEILWGLIANGENTLFDLWISLWIRGVAPAWQAKQDPQISRRSLPKAFDPFFNKAQGTTDCGCKLGLRPFWMIVQVSSQ